MDTSTFYALFSATCFTLLGLWWNVLQDYPGWTDSASQRRAVGGIYLTFLLPAMMGLFAQVGGTETPEIWRASFVVVAIVGCFCTVRLLRVQDRSGRDQPRSKYAAALVVYALVAVLGAFPRIVDPLGIAPIQAEALLLIGLVLVGHGLVWDFMVRARTGAEPVPGQHTREPD